MEKSKRGLLAVCLTVLMSVMVCVLALVIDDHVLYLFWEITVIAVLGFATVCILDWGDDVDH